MDAVLALEVCHASGSVHREADQLLRLQLVLLLPQEGQEVSTWHETESGEVKQFISIMLSTRSLQAEEVYTSPGIGTSIQNWYHYQYLN